MNAYESLTDDQRELVLYAENTSELYDQFLSIIRNLQRKIKRGTYNPALAPKLWRYWVDAAAARYRKEMCEPGSRLFTVSDRNAVAAYFAETEYASITNGEYDEED